MIEAINTTEQLIREDLKQIQPYSSARSLKVSGEIWLNANESPYNDEYLYNRYPEPQPKALVEKLSNIYDVDEKNILVTRGSDEGIDLLFRLYCEYKKDTVFAVEPTFGMYKVAAQIQGVDYISISLKKENDFNIDIDEILKNLPSRCKLLFLCTPNNPTGKSISLSDIESILQALTGKCIVVIDEAYIEFSEERSATFLINKYENLVVLRTLSKLFGMAGLRLGSLITNATRINWLKKILAPYPIPKSTESIVLSLLDSQHLLGLESQLHEIKFQREYLIEVVSRLNITDKIWPSDANFILVRFKQDLFQVLIDNKIVVRSMQHFFNEANTLRISVGTVAENKKLIEILNEVSKDYETE